MSEIAVNTSIDARGMPCPGPLMSLIGAIRAGSGRRRRSRSCRATRARHRHPRLAAKAGHELVEMAEEDGFTSFVVRKAR